VAGRLWHVSSSLNRASVAEHGLDWRWMTITTGIARAPGRDRTFTPELAAVFLCESLDSVEFFVGFGRHPLVDVWQVDARGLAIEPAPDGWVMCRSPIAATRVRLLHADRPPEPRDLCTATLGFTSTRLMVEEMSALAGISPDDAGDEPGAAIDDLDDTEPHAWWVIEASDRYAPLHDQVEELVARIAGAEPGLTRLAAAADRATFVVRGHGRERALSGRTRALLRRMGVDIEEL
jgi:hypothetical protein